MLSTLQRCAGRRSRPQKKVHTHWRSTGKEAKFTRFCRGRIVPPCSLMHFDQGINLIELYNWYSRYEHGSAAIIPIGFVLSLIIVLILLFTGWKGWEMVYKHRVGVADL